MVDWLGALGFIIAAWGVILALVTGIGLLVVRALGQRIDGAEPVFTSFWVGWCAILVFLQPWNLFFPVNTTALALLAATGAVGLLASGPDLARLVRRSGRAAWPYAIALLGIGFWLATRAIGAPTWDYDTGLYYLQSVRWSETYPVVPGLGNLYGPLAFNRGYYLYPAVLGAGPWGERSIYVANTALFVAAFAQVIWAGFRLLRHRNHWRYADALTVLLLPPILQSAFSGNPASFSMDAPVLLLSVVLAGRLFQYLETPPARLSHMRYEAFVIVLIASTGVSVKLTSAVFGAGVVVLTGLVWLARQPGFRWRALWQTWLVPVTAALLVLIPWTVRGVMLSGYVAFPSTLGAFPVEWRVPRDRTIAEADTITQWARSDRAGYNAPPGTPWFKDWLDRTLRVDGVRFALGLVGTASFLLIERWGLSRKPRRTAWVRWTFLIPVVVALVFWVWAAPAYRFAAGLFWMLGMGALVLAIGEYGPSEHAPAFVVAVAVGLSLVWPVELWNPTEPGSDHGFYPLPQPVLQPVEIAPGQWITVPTETDQCWYAPLPCAPQALPGLRLRDPNDLSAGFMIE